MALKTLKSATTTEAAKPSKSKTLQFAVAGKLIQAFDKADVDAKDAKSRRDIAAEEIKAIGLKHLYETNSGRPGAPESSVRLVDETGSEALVCLQEKYSAVDPAAAEALFEELHKDINQYVQQCVTVDKFDNTVFLDRDGNFNETVYNAFTKGVAELTAKLGIGNPLQTSVKVLPKPTFHTVRFTDFRANQQAKISEVLKTTVTSKAGKLVEDSAAKVTVKD